MRGVSSQKIVRNEGFIDAIGMRGVDSSFLIWLRMQSEESEFDLNQIIKFPYLQKSRHARIEQSGFENLLTEVGTLSVRDA